MVEFSLPFPPSVNHYWHRSGNHVFIGAKGREFREASIAIIDQSAKKNGYVLPAFASDVEIEVYIFPPDKRKRDLDNILKALFDALTHGKVLKDDSQIKCAHIYMCRPVSPGSVSVSIRALPALK